MWKFGEIHSVEAKQETCAQGHLFGIDSYATEVNKEIPDCERGQKKDGMLPLICTSALVGHFGKVPTSNGSWIYRKIKIVTASFVPFTYDLVQQIPTDLKVILYFRKTFLLFYTLMSYRNFLQNTLLKQKEKKDNIWQENCKYKKPLCIKNSSNFFL